MDKLFVMKRFLRKLANLDIWGGRHTELINLKKALPKHLRGERVTDEAIKDLISLELITTKQSTGEIHISLNSKKQILEFKPEAAAVMENEKAGLLNDLLKKEQGVNTDIYSGIEGIIKIAK